MTDFGVSCEFPTISEYEGSRPFYQNHACVYEKVFYSLIKVKLGNTEASGEQCFSMVFRKPYSNKCSCLKSSIRSELGRVSHSFLRNLQKFFFSEETLSICRTSGRESTVLLQCTVRCIIEDTFNFNLLKAKGSP